jgi:DNA-binding CsgD family transcriptional regulator
VEGPTLLEQRGRLRALQGRTAEAIADLLNAGRQADEREVDSPLMTVWRSEAALCFAAEGRAGEAIRLAEENLALARSYGVPWAVGSALHVLAIVGEPDECLARLEQAVQLLDGSPAKVQLASALIDLGHALRQAGASPSEARNALRSGADIAFRSGANPLLSKATSELRLSGARPRRLALSGTQALTSSQSRIVSLAVAGLTNPEIADALFLSKKTVEGHLHHAYRKLGVRSRSDLKGGAIPAQRND